MTFFSEIGKNMILPQDVLIQSKETQEISGAINATIGMATLNNKVMKLSTLEKIVKDLKFNEYLPYAPTSGNINIRKLWKNKILKENDSLNESYLSDPIVTSGITQGIDIAATLFSQKEDALLLPELYWQNYEQIYKVKLKNNIYTFKQYNENNNYNIEDFTKTLESIKENKISLILNFPNNPTGYTPSKEEFKNIVNSLKNFLIKNPNKTLIILSDDAYFGLFFENNHKNSTLNSISELVEFNNCLLIKVDGATKEYFSWGLRIGFITYYNKNKNLLIELMNKTQGFLRSSTSSPSNISSQIIQKLLLNEEAEKEKIYNNKLIEERYKKLKECIKIEKLESYCKILPFNSGYFFTIKLNSKINAHKFRKELLYKYKIGIYSMDNYHIRIAFSCLDIEEIPIVIKNIKKCLLEFNN